MISDQPYLMNLVTYIHYNPVQAGLCKKLQDWKHSSFNDIACNNNEFIKSKEVNEWFNEGGQDFLSEDVVPQKIIV